MTTIEERVNITMHQHLELANKYERLGNAEGAARLRSTANMLGMIRSLSNAQRQEVKLKLML